ncbi:response regulator [Pedobacter nutrimenti]|jgi:CheY-like chemotaxis protein|uniref:Response regulator receiver domain-containing protein n=1 Tax=Pedobacter nutrimenti TaxID=1241337 RepID=A0A318ULA8_9SPHI|nr:response regulator [Pedobacter nutrimenti]PYF76863.1 response regulator receiver domain-containing protein [Pedobacter nutrimenti]
MFTDKKDSNSISGKYQGPGNFPQLDRFLLWSPFNVRKETMESNKEKRKSILVVDDELSILKLLSFILSADYELIIKKSGIEAIDWLEEGNDPDLIISDLMMPYFDGSTLIRNLKISGFYRNTPVILLSGTEDLAEKVKEMPFQIEGYMEKPFNPASLKSQISQLIH